MIDSQHQSLVIGGLFLYTVVSYSPQHLRIFRHRTSGGLSPWYLFLSVTGSTTAALYSILQYHFDLIASTPVDHEWGVIRLGNSSVFSPWTCLNVENAVLLTILPCIMVITMFTLYIVYFPQTNKRHDVSMGTNARTNEWRVSIALAWTAGIFLILGLMITSSVMVYSPKPSPIQTLSPFVYRWMAFLSIVSALCSVGQYIPQVIHTYRLKVVMSLSIPALCLQTLSSILICTSLVVRINNDWMSFIVIVVSSIPQISLLSMCLAWKLRQRRLRVDDFGNPISSESIIPHSTPTRYGSITGPNSHKTSVEVSGSSSCLASTSNVLGEPHCEPTEDEEEGPSEDGRLGKRPCNWEDILSADSDNEQFAEEAVECEDGNREAIEDSTPMIMDKKRSSRAKRSGKGRLQPERSEVVWYAM